MTKDTSSIAVFCILMAIAAGFAGYFLIPKLVSLITKKSPLKAGLSPEFTTRGTLMPSLSSHKAFVRRTGASFPTISTEYPALMTRFASTAVGREGRSDRPALGKRLGAWHDPREDVSVRQARHEQIRAVKNSLKPSLLLNYSEDFYTAMGK